MKILGVSLDQPIVKPKIQKVNKELRAGLVIILARVFITVVKFAFIYDYQPLLK